MEDEFNLEKIKTLFAHASGERTIEVTDQEFEKLYQEALEKGFKVNKESEHFTLQMGDLNIKITCEFDEDFEDEDEDE
jgi:hypothetical protein